MLLLFSLVLQAHASDKAVPRTSVDHIEERTPETEREAALRARISRLEEAYAREDTRLRSLEACTDATSAQAPAPTSERDATQQVAGMERFAQLTRGESLGERTLPVSTQTCGACKAAIDDTRSQQSRCARCKTEYYCSKECQKSHWREHKRWCVDVKRGNECSICLESRGDMRALNTTLHPHANNYFCKTCWKENGVRESQSIRSSVENVGGNTISYEERITRSTCPICNLGLTVDDLDDMHDKVDDQPGVYVFYKCPWTVAPDPEGKMECHLYKWFKVTDRGYGDMDMVVETPQGKMVQQLVLSPKVDPDTGGTPKHPPNYPMLLAKIFARGKGYVPYVVKEPARLHSTLMFADHTPSAILQLGGAHHRPGVGFLTTGTTSDGHWNNINLEDSYLLPVGNRAQAPAPPVPSAPGPAPSEGSDESSDVTPPPGAAPTGK